MSDRENLYDAVVVGGGPAGLTAALYLARARYRVLVVEKDRFGGQIAITDEVVNYPGVLRASGAELGDAMRRQAEAFGAEFSLAEVTGLDMGGDVKRVSTTRGEVRCLGVLLATGASPRRVGFTGEDEFRGHGVAYCATCDGEFFTGKEVFVVGGGFAAAEEAMFLTRYAKRVTIFVRRDRFSCAESVVEELAREEKISVRFNTVVEEVAGDTALRSMRYRDTATGEVHEYRAEPGETFGVFVFVGYAPATELVSGVAALDEGGYVVTDAEHRTTAAGLFAAGDVCVKELRQVATAVGDAAEAASALERWCKEAQEKTGLVPTPPAPAGAPKAPAAGAKDAAPSGSSELFDEGMRAQLAAVFGRMQRSMTLQVCLDARPVASELRGYMEELAKQSDGKLAVEVLDEAAARDAGIEELPCVRVLSPDGAWTGLAFHGVPGGHEFTSFVLGLYNAAGPGQPIDEADRAAAQAIADDVRIKVLVGLSCTMCPEVVVAAQRIAALNPHVSADVYDINHFEALKDRYQVMSVPCLVIDRAGAAEQVSFGRKSLSQVLAMIG